MQSNLLFSTLIFSQYLLFLAGLINSWFQNKGSEIEAELRGKDCHVQSVPKPFLSKIYRKARFLLKCTKQMKSPSWGWEFLRITPLLITFSSLKLKNSLTARRAFDLKIRFSHSFRKKRRRGSFCRVRKWSEEKFLWRGPFRVVHGKWAG